MPAELVREFDGDFALSVAKLQVVESVIQNQQVILGPDLKWQRHVPDIGIRIYFLVKYSFQLISNAACSFYWNKVG